MKVWVWIFLFILLLAIAGGTDQTGYCLMKSGKCSEMAKMTAGQEKTASTVR